jgi:hypothetical protein
MRMDEIHTGVLRDIVKDQERIGKRTISVEVLLERLGLTPLIDASELDRLRAIEAFARKIVSDPRSLVRGIDYDDASALKRLVLDELPPDALTGR